MPGKDLGFLGKLTDEERFFVGSVYDKLYAARDRYNTCFTFFLSERQAELSKMVLASECCGSYLLYGGSESSERLMLGIFAEHETPAEEAFPIKALKFTYRAGDKLTHRDFLGSLMSLGITRESVGDIRVGEGSTVVFLTDTAAREARSVSKVGRVGVRITEGYDPQELSSPELLPITGTVSALRLDCVLALALRCSRTKADTLITSGAVTVRGQTIDSVSKRIDEGDTFTARGYGKYILSKIGRSTKKDRVFIEIGKFK